jgi:hypothetical protein
MLQRCAGDKAAPQELQKRPPATQRFPQSLQKKPALATGCGALLGAC